MRAVRPVLAVIAGFVVASAVMMAMELANAKLFHPGFAEKAAARDAEIVREAGRDADPKALALMRREAVREILAGAPVSALLVVVAGWILGSVAGGFVTRRLGRLGPRTVMLALGGLLTLAGIANNLMLPPPLWFWIASLVVFLPATFLGARLAPAPIP